MGNLSMVNSIVLSNTILLTIISITIFLGHNPEIRVRIADSPQVSYLVIGLFEKWQPGKTGIWRSS